VSTDDKGRRHGPLKKSIKENNPEKKPLNSDKAAEYITAHDRNLIAEYRSQVDSEFEPLTAEEIDDRIVE
jgi:hypothetical protein